MSFLHPKRHNSPFRGPDMQMAKTPSTIGEAKQEPSELFGAPSLPPAPRSVPQVTSAYADSIQDLMDHLNRTKLTDGKPLRPPHIPSDNVCLVGETTGRIKWIQPSGPRPAGHGTEDEEQGIVSAEATASGGAMLRITLLASGFIIGTSGSSVREICKQTGADVKSWTDHSKHEGGPQHTRTFVIEGRRRAVILAVNIICDAVDRYKELCEGAFCGQYVSRSQNVRGIDFSYQPPPRNVVPYAAALSGQGNRSKSRERTGSQIRSQESEGHILQDVNSTLNIHKRGTVGHDKSPPAHRHAALRHAAFANENLDGNTNLAIGRDSPLHHGQLPPGYVLFHPTHGQMMTPEALRQSGYIVDNLSYASNTGVGTKETEAHHTQQQATPAPVPPLPAYGQITTNGAYQGGMYSAGLQQMMLNEFLATGHYHAGLPDTFQELPGIHQQVMQDYMFGNNVPPICYSAVQHPAPGFHSGYHSPAPLPFPSQPAMTSRGNSSSGLPMSPWVQGNHPFLMGTSGSNHTGH